MSALIFKNLPSMVMGVREYYTDAKFQQDRLDGGRHYSVLLGEVSKIITATKLWDAYYPKNFYALSAEKFVFYGSFIGLLGYVSFEQNAKINEKFKKAIEISAPIIRLVPVVNVIALYALGKYSAASILLFFNVLTLLHSRQMVPASVEQALCFIELPIEVVHLFSATVSGKRDLLLRMERVSYILNRLNDCLLRYGMGVSAAELGCSKPEEIDQLKIADFFKEYKSKSVEDWWSQVEFSPTSVHRIPPLFAVNSLNNKEDRKNLVRQVDDRAKALKLEELTDLENIKKTFIDGVFSDKVIAKRDEFQNCVQAMMEYLLTLDDDQFKTKIKTLNEAGKQCVDYWLEEISKMHPGTTKGLANKIHEKFGKVRSEWLEECSIKVQKKIKGLRLIERYGGINDVHLQQMFHLWYPNLRTRGFQVAQTSSGNTLGSCLLAKIFRSLIKKFLFSVEETFRELNSQYWVKQLLSAMKLEKYEEKYWQEISSAELSGWLSEVNDEYKLFDEDTFQWNESFICEQQVEEKKFLQLTEKGALLVLLNIGVLRLKG